MGEKRKRLEEAGFVVGERNPCLNRNYPGKFMVVEPFEEDELPTDDGANGPWCIVGDDLNDLIEQAFEVWSKKMKYKKGDWVKRAKYSSGFLDEFT